MKCEHPCPSCGGAAILAQFPNTVRRGDRRLDVVGHKYVCPHGCLDGRDEPLSFVTKAVSEADWKAVRALWTEKFGEPIPEPAKPGRPMRAGAPSDTRVPVLFTAAEVEEIDRRRGSLSRSDYVRNKVLGGRASHG